MDQNYWRKCGSCKKEIGFSTVYQTCNVSTCKKLVFCSVDCWNLHNPVMNHKSSWAEENKSPSKEKFLSENSEEHTPRRIIVQTPREGINNPKTSMDQEVLIVASKLKQYIKEKYDMNTSASVMDVLSDKVRHLTDKAYDKARSEGRKTIMDRDFE